jgi:M6 family metalloprotease-like protein
MPQFSSEATELNFTIPYPVPKPSPLFGQISVLVIAVEFPDLNHTLSIEEAANHTIGQLDAYYRQISYDAVSVVGKVVGWIRLPHKISQYGTDNGPFIDDQDGDGYPDTWQLLKDAIPMIANEVDLTAYQQFFVLHAGYGQESSRKASDIWSVTYVRWTMDISQRSFDQFAIVPEFEARGLETLGVYAHEFGHLLGLPDLYSSTIEQVGPWDLMARGAWNGKPAGSSPAEMIAWDRIFLGWISPEHILNVTKQTRVNATVDPIELPSPALQAVRVQASSQDSKHYYLVEVRQKIGFDAALPTTGVLITYIDETKSNPVKVIDAAQTTSTLDDAPFQVGQKYIDSDNSVVISVVSTDESSFSVTVDTLAPNPDVVVESFSLDPPTVHPNNTVSLNVRVANEGTLKAKTFGVEIYLNETLFASRKIALNAGEGQLIQLSWTPTTTGTYFFKVVLDAEKVLSENNRENNIKTFRVVVGLTLTLVVRPPGAGGDLRWWLAVNGVNETYVGVGEFQIAVAPGSNTLEIQPAIYLNPSSRYIFRQWGDGVVSNPRVIEISSDMSLSTDFTPQYLLSLEPNGGATSSGGWYDSGTSITISATSPTNVVEKQSRLVFLNWSGDVESNSTTVEITMSQPHNVTANWKTQYYLNINSPYTASGEGWYDADSQATISLSTTMTTGNGTRHLFTQWSGDLSGADPNQLIVMSGPRFVSAIWNTQYELRIESEYGHTAGAGWYAPNVQATFIVDTLAIESANGTRRVFTKWSGDAAGADPQETVTMDAAKVIRANWTTQYRVTLAVQGIRNGTEITIIADGKPYKVKVPQAITFWHDAGSSVSFSANATVTEGFRRYVLKEWSNSTGDPVKSPRYVLKPETFTVAYRELSMFPCIIATVTFGSEVTPEVQFLRNFRDSLVLSTRAGSAFMNVFNMWYYSFSPQVADFIASHDSIRSPARIGLYPLIGVLELSSATYSALAFSPEFAVIVAGMLASGLIGLIYLTPIVLFFIPLRKRIGGVTLRKACAVSCLAAVASVVLGELTGSLGLLAVATSALVLTTVVSAPLLFSFALVRIWILLDYRQR